MTESANLIQRHRQPPRHPRHIHLSPRLGPRSLLQARQVVWAKVLCGRKRSTTFNASSLSMRLESTSNGTYPVLVLSPCRPRSQVRVLGPDFGEAKKRDGSYFSSQVTCTSILMSWVPGSIGIARSVALTDTIFGAT